MPHAVRRLLALSTLLSTLAAGFGWSHAACETAADGTMAEMDGQHAMERTQAAEGSGVGQDASDSHSGCHHMASDGDGAPGAPANTCSMVAHCGSALVTPTRPSASFLASADLPPEERVTLPADPAHEPELQPPRA